MEFPILANGKTIKQDKQKLRKKKSSLHLNILTALHRINKFYLILKLTVTGKFRS